MSRPEDEVSWADDVTGSRFGGLQALLHPVACGVDSGPESRDEDELGKSVSSHDRVEPLPVGAKREKESELLSCGFGELAGHWILITKASVIVIASTAKMPADTCNGTDPWRWAARYMPNPMASPSKMAGTFAQVFWSLNAATIPNQTTEPAMAAVVPAAAVAPSAGLVGAITPIWCKPVLSLGQVLSVAAAGG